MHVGTIMESRDAIFFENIFPMRDETSSSRQEIIEEDISTEPIVHNEFTPMDPEEDNNEAPRKSKRQGLQSLLVMISLYSSWMTHLGPLKRHIHLLMMTIGRKK
jgi:hypothetical protein